MSDFLQAMRISDWKVSNAKGNLRSFCSSEFAGYMVGFETALLEGAAGYPRLGFRAGTTLTFFYSSHPTTTVLKWPVIQSRQTLISSLQMAA